MAINASWKWATTFLSILVIFTMHAGAQQVKPELSGQSVFGIENEVEHPAILPDGILNLLRTDGLVRRMGCLRDGYPQPQALWFLTSAVHLGGSHEIDFVVQNNPELESHDNRCLFGANIGPFWIFRQTPAGYELLLSTSALGLKIRDSRTKGYRDIEVGSATVTTVSSGTFKFDGHKYELHENKLEPIR